MDRTARILTIALLVGFCGDILLQIGAHVIGNDWAGLPRYFAQHGSAESLFIASGMLGLFYALYIMTGLPLKFQYLALYGIVIDLVFRETRLFPSLDGYYKHLNYIESAFWAALPMCLPLLVEKML